MRISDWSSDVCSSDLLGRIGQGPAQGVGQGQFGQQVRLECCQALAEVNQSMQLAFDLGFAFFTLVEGVVVRINHGGSPQRNAAMITSRGPLVRPGRSKASGLYAKSRRHYSYKT